jgi:hypothetical protein
MQRYIAYPGHHVSLKLRGKADQAFELMGKI